MFSPQSRNAGESVGAETAGMLEFLKDVSDGEKAKLLEQIDKTSLKSSNSIGSQTSLKI